MKCEIVQNWVGNMENTFFYCRDHKCECPSSNLCGSELPEIALVPVADHSPWWMNVKPGDRVVCTVKPPVGLFVVGMTYHLFVDQFAGVLCLRDENSWSVKVEGSSTWMNYFQLSK